MIRHNCPRCKARLKTPEGVERVKCPKCGQVVEVPAEDKKVGLGGALSAGLDWEAKKREYDRRQAAWKARWPTPPMTTGGAIFAVAGVVVGFIGAAVLLTAGPDYSYFDPKPAGAKHVIDALQGGFCLVVGFLMIAIGMLSRKVARPPTRHEGD